MLYIDLHLIHEVTSPQAFSVLKSLGLPVRRPDRTLATMDHSTPTSTEQVFGNVPIKVDAAAKQVRQLEQNAAEFGIELFGMRDARRGIVHVISPELGSTQPGMTIVCGDSHTSTHGAFGALAFGIGTTEVGHVFATQALLQRKPKTFAVNVEGRLRPGVTAKDLILAVIGKIGVSGGTGHVLEYRGSAIRALSMDERMTVCNMSIEAGARAGMIAPDDTTFAYLEGKPRAPRGAQWEAAVARWRTLRTDPGAKLRCLRGYRCLGARTHDHLRHQSRHGAAHRRGHPGQAGRRSIRQGACATWDFTAAMPCSANRWTSCSSAAAPTDGSRICRRPRKYSRAARSRPACACSSCRARRTSSVRPKRPGYADIFKAAGADWRESGCSMCLGMNGDTVAAGQYSVSTSNRNFEGRQGVGARTLLASPYTAAASAVRGRITDPRELL